MTYATIVADAQDSMLTLNRVVSLLRGRCFAVVSFTAARSHRPGIARLTIVVDGARTRPARVAACLAKLADVWNVNQLEPADSLVREMALVRVRCPVDRQPTALEEMPHEAVQVVHRDDTSMLLQVVAEPARLDAMLREMALPILEVLRSGIFASSLGAGHVADADASTRKSTY